MQSQPGPNKRHLYSVWKRLSLFLCIFCGTNLLFYLNTAINPSLQRTIKYNATFTIPSIHPEYSKLPEFTMVTEDSSHDPAKRAIVNFFSLKVTNISALSFRFNSSAAKMWNFILNYRENSTVDVVDFLNASLTENSVTRQLIATLHNNAAKKLIKNYVYNNEYIINEPNVCKGRKIDLIVVVCSAINKFSERVAIRETWGHYTHNQTNSAKLVFLLGNTNDKDLTKNLVAESEKYHDIIQKDFIDSYRNLTLKSIAMVKWVKDFCKNSRFTLKTDDDMYVNLPNLVSNMKKQKHKEFVFGHVFTGARPVQDKHSKWYTPKESFQEKVYPQYCSGTAYAMTTGAASELYMASLQIEPFWLEDIYMTGLCARMANIPRIHSWGFTFLPRKPNGCIYNSVITGHHVTVKQMYQIYAQLDDRQLKCQ